MSGVRNLRLEVILQAIDRATRPIRAVMQSNKGLAAAVKESRDRLKELNAQQGKIDAFRQLTRDAKETGDKLAAARQKVRELAASMAASGAPTQQMARQMQRAEIAVERLTQANKKKIEAAKAAKAALEAAGVSTNRLAGHESQLRGEISASTRALQQQEARLARANRQQQQMNAARAQYARGMATRDKMAGAGASMMGAGAAAGAAVLAPVREFAQAEDSATQLKVAMMGAGGVVKKEFSDINALAEKLGNQLPGTTSDFQDMMKVLIQKGLDAKVVLGGAGEATAKLAVLTNIGFAESADAISVFQDAMQVADKDMVAAADQMQRLYNVGMKVSDIQEGFKAMGPALAYMRKGGIDAVKAISPLLAITDAAGMDAGSAGNAFNKIIRGSVDKKKVDKANTVLKDQGVKLNFVDAKGNFAGVDNMVNQIMKIQGLTDQKRKTVIETIFGSDKEVAEALNALGKAGNPGIEAMRKKLADQASLQERVNAQLSTLKNLWDAATGTFTNAMVRFGEAIAPEVKMLTEWIGNLAEQLGTWAKENPDLANGLMKVVGVLAIVLTAMGALTLAAAAVFGPMLIAKAGFAMFAATLGGGAGMVGVLANGFNLLMRVFGLVGGALFKLMGVLRLLFAVMMANPAIAIVAVLAGAAIYIWQNWATLGPKFMAMWNSIKAGAAAVWSSVQAQAMAVGQALVAFFMNWTLPGLIYSKWDSILAWMTNLPTRFLAIGGQIIDGMMAGIDGKWEALKAKIASIADSLTGTIKSALGIHSPSRVFAALGGYTMAGLDQGLTDGQQGPLSTVMGMAKQLTAAGTGIALGVGSAVAGGVSIDQRAPIAAPAAAAGSGAAGGASSTNIFQIYQQPGQSSQELAREIEKIMDARERRQAAGKRSRLGDSD